jgi:translocation and assembly module TamB
LTNFSVEQFPLALLALITNVPDDLRGALAANGRFRIGDGRRRPELQMALALQDAALGTKLLKLDRGELDLANDTISLDWSLRSEGAANGIDLKGTVPLQPDRQDLELRVASRGDGLQFLSVLADSGLQWKQGSADLQLLVRGSLQAPVANGFLRFRNGVLQVAGQTMRELEATVLFDFSELELQQLTARVGERGQISGSGQLGLTTPIAQAQRLLKLQVQQAPFQLPRMQAEAAGEVLVSGSLLRPVLSGELQLSRGRINVQPGQLATEEQPSRPVSVRDLVEERWDFRDPLLVMGQQMESSASRDLRSAVPNLPFLSFDGLRLRLGPDLRVGVPNVLNFNSGGVLTLRGPLDPSLQVSGVVRLLNGRLSLFTTNFSLDPDAPNVAVFTPSLGLIPYVDIALRTRVSDTIGLNDASRTSLSDWNVNAPTNSIDQLRLVKVRVEASGPADRLADSIRLTSSPPLPQERLVALIGGNSLVGLAGGNAGAALATVLGQSLLSPLVGGLSDAFGQRLTFALYPTYFAPAEVQAAANRSRRLPSQLVLGSEIGLDLSERFNFSVLAAPNRSDIPPQMTLRYQASDRIGVQTSIDTEGRWQSQLQLLFRF